MRKWFAFGRLLPLICALLVATCASAFAAAGTDWEIGRASCRERV